MASMEQLWHALKQAQTKKFGPPKEILGMVDEWKGKGENLLESLADCVADIVSREEKLSMVGKSLEKRLKVLEKRERDFESFRERKKRDLDLKERSLSPMLEDFGKEAELKEKKLDEQLEFVHEHIESLEAAHSKVEGLRLRECEKLKEIEKREKEVDFIRGSVERRLREVEQREKEIDLFRDGKLEELALEEEILNRRKKGFVKEVKLANEKFKDNEKKACCLIERLEFAVDMLDSKMVTINAKFKEMESWETKVHNEANLIEESLEKGFREFDKLESEFNTSQEGKMQELEAKEYRLSIERKALRKEVVLKEKKVIEQQKLGRQLVDSLKDMIAVKLKEIDSQKLTLDVAREKLEASAKDADFKMESANMRLQELEKREEKFGLYREKKMRELVVAEEKLRLIAEEIIQMVKFREEEFDKHEKLVHGLLKRLELASNNVKDINAMVCDRSKEVGVNNIKNPIKREIDESEFNARELGGQTKGIKAKGDGLISKKNELEQKTSKPYSNLRVKPEESLDLENNEQIEGNTLKMLLTDTEKDFELIADEVFKVLLLSSDPAKLVRDEIEGFCRSHWKRGALELHESRNVIFLLDQLAKMSPKIHPCVREDAIILATEWQWRMSITAENSWEVLGFLHLLVAYDLTSHFNKDELLSLLKMVAKHKQTPELWRILGLTKEIPGFIHNLINEKQYLLASTYIYECELEERFPQRAVLDYYLKHSKMLAKSKCTREHNSVEAQDKAIVSEIADLRVAIEHIIKYGLESECSPDILSERIQQLERDRARLRSSDVQKQKIDASKRRHVDQGPMTPQSHGQKRLRTNNTTFQHRLRR